MQAFLLQLGWDIAPGVALVEAVHASAATVYELVAGGDEGETPDLTALLSGLRAAYVAVADIASGGGGLPAEFAGNEFPRQLADYLLVTLWLLRHQPRVGSTCWVLMGIVRLEEKPAIPPRARRTCSTSSAFEGFGAFSSRTRSSSLGRTPSAGDRARSTATLRSHGRLKGAGFRVESIR